MHKIKPYILEPLRRLNSVQSHYQLNAIDAESVGMILRVSILLQCHKRSSRVSGRLKLLRFNALHLMAANKAKISKGISVDATRAPTNIEAKMKEGCMLITGLS